MAIDPSGDEGLPTPLRAWAIASVALAIAMTVLDSSIANVALPTIAREFGAAPAESIWIVNAYQLAIVIGPAAAGVPGRDRRLPAHLPAPA